ncbi:hypothetical protein GM415_16080 [Pseudodesulfovibrio cashew]|uniref:PilZ domain-containing protein n=1 Tax=Pseudodesulfovibrio cashew TaxID=2678688 RepID=A0A6I6JV19_9BACT|nr:hypothetical protein [Pseudodesulfovibrio cashew]QGY41574.1 hypothetical protein GM415_16080 [Pseudodesulfovibrio cashew]
MLEYMAQFDYLRDVQRTFQSGSGRVDLVGVFTDILLVAVPVVVAVALWYYHKLIGFKVLRFFTRLLSMRTHRIVQNYLVSKGVMLDMYLYTGKGVGRKLGNVRVQEVVGGKMRLQLVDVRPTAVKLKNARVICFCKPFTYSGRKLNAFVTFVGHADKRGATIRSMTLLTPIRYRFVIRRRHSRKLVAREGGVRVKAWDITKRNAFWMARPDLQTVNNPKRYGDKMRLAVEDISPGGIRLLILNPVGKLPSLVPGHQLVLRVSVWNRDTKKYSYFNAIGTVRSRFSGKGGSVGLGIQFMASGEKEGSGYIWKKLDGEIPALARFLEQAE